MFGVESIDLDAIVDDDESIRIGSAFNTVGSLVVHSITRVSSISVSGAALLFKSTANWLAHLIDF